MELDQEMADFAELFRGPATPSLLRRLRDEDSPERSIPSDLASIPSDQLFSKYLTSESHTAEGGYSPSDPPLISDRVVTISVTGTEPEYLATRETLPAEPEHVTPVPSTEEANDLLSHSSFPMDIEPESLATRETSSVEPVCHSCAAN